MTYTVKGLAKISGVSVRTLHWYDKAGLLKPAFHGENGYRYYEEAQLLCLQQILFFKELGFTLREIASLLLQNDFDNIKALYAHRKILEEDVTRKNDLMETIDKTIQHLKGKQAINDKELYDGFDRERQKEYEYYLVQYHGTIAEDLLAKSKKPVAKWDKEEWDPVKVEGDSIYKSLCDAICRGSSPESLDVQKIIQRHYVVQGRFFDLTKEVYLELANLYSEHPDFKKFFDPYHPMMVQFIGEAIKFYAHKNL